MLHGRESARTALAGRGIRCSNHDLVRIEIAQLIDLIALDTC